MSESYHVVCPNCTAVNRMPREKKASAGKCGKCGARLFDGHPVPLDGLSFPRHLESNDIPVVVDFWADWCGPCKMMAPVFEQVAGEMEPEVRFAKVDTEAVQDVAMRYAIRSIPTLVLFKNGRQVARQAGAMPAEHLKSWIRQHV